MSFCSCLIIGLLFESDNVSQLNHFIREQHVFTVYVLSGAGYDDRVEAVGEFVHSFTVPQEVFQSLFHKDLH